MKTLILFLASSLAAFSQTKVNENIQATNVDRVKIEFDYPQIIKISTWDKSEIQITGSVSINNGANDDAFKLNFVNKGGTILIENNIVNLKNLPRRLTVQSGNKRLVFNSTAEYERYKNESGETKEYTSFGVDIDITLEVKIPNGVQTDITSIYGIVEVGVFQAPLIVLAKYGGVDASIMEGEVGTLTAETNYGQIYSNLDVKFNADPTSTKSFHTLLKSAPGSGPAYTFTSNYGNVYMRKRN